MEKMKQNKSNEETHSKKKPKMTQDEELAQIQIKSIEKDCLDRVFVMLSEMQNLPSSDEETTQKKYKKEIEAKANEKKMKVSTSNFVPKMSLSTKKTKKTFKEDETLSKSPSNNSNTLGMTGKKDENNEKKGKIGIKGVRKILRKLCEEYIKEEMEMMIWEVDENLDGYVSENEFEKMYKRCIADERELQPKKLFYLVQFLMYDKEQKTFITEEDTLEILYIRHGPGFESVIDAIFE
jgi:hypothetical protein